MPENQIPKPQSHLFITSYLFYPIISYIIFSLKPKLKGICIIIKQHTHALSL